MRAIVAPTPRSATTSIADMRMALRLSSLLSLATYCTPCILSIHSMNAGTITSLRIVKSDYLDPNV